MLTLIPIYVEIEPKWEASSESFKEVTTVIQLVSEEGVKEGTRNRDIGGGEGGTLELVGFKGHTFTVMGTFTRRGVGLDTLNYPDYRILDDNATSSVPFDTHHARQ